MQSTEEKATSSRDSIKHFPIQTVEPIDRLTTTGIKISHIHICGFIGSRRRKLTSKVSFGKMSRYLARIGPQVHSALGKWAYNASGFNQLGLHRDDCLYENEDVKEAIRRLPRKVYDERNYRLMRAIHLSMTKTILPKEQWTKYEEDVKYLEPYLNEVVREREEREDWDKNL